MRILTIIILIAWSFVSMGQRDSIAWHLTSMSQSQKAGISLLEAKAFLNQQKRTPKIVVVAIIDSGVDTAQEDLRDRLWKNPKEIPFNRIDEDGNGYVDDYHGWNFIGGPNGKNIDGENLEFVRFYAAHRNQFENKSIKQISAEDKAMYEMWAQSKVKYESFRDIALKRIETYNDMLKMLDKSQKRLKDYLQTDTLTQEMVGKIKTDDEVILKDQRFLLWAYQNEVDKNYYLAAIDHYNKELAKKYNPDYQPRPAIVGDRVDDITDSIYGNDDVTGPIKASSHGTGVAGIVGAISNNGKGSMGIVDSVQLMILRVVPGGDEYDKDVALAIRYAVNNGAKIINCSFGKDMSPHPDFVRQAIDYAIAHDVLIVHAAGNSSENNDKILHFPTPLEHQRSHWIDVAASGSEIGPDLAARFTNFGAKTVDVFAPGVNIYTCSPENNYRSSSGTSDAAPIVTGLAALLSSYYPELSASQIRTIILQSAITYPKVKVNRPDNQAKTTKLNKLTTTGGIVNAEKAAQLAAKTAEEIKAK